MRGSPIETDRSRTTPRSFAGSLLQRTALLLIALAMGGASAIARPDLPQARESSSRPPITVIFRFDDYSTTSDTHLEQEILRAFQERGLRLTVGVIPEIAAVSAFDPSPQGTLPLPPDKLEILRLALASGTVEVAQHGLSHQTVRVKLPGGFKEPFGRYHSEFIGVARDAQQAKIEKGRRFLETALPIRVETFIPPWNGYDQTTLRVLEEMGFRAFSAARRGPLVSSSRLKFLPRTCDLWEVRHGVEAARRGDDPDPVVLALFHQYDFKENHPEDARTSVPELRELLDWLAAQKDVGIETISEAARSGSDFGVRRFYWNRNALLWQITPPWVDKFFQVSARAVYLSVPAARREKILIWAIVIVLYLATAAVSGAMAWGVALPLYRFVPILARLAPAASFLALVTILVYALRDLEPWWFGIAVASATAGAWVGLWACRRRRFPPTRSAPRLSPGEIGHL